MLPSRTITFYKRNKKIIDKDIDNLWNIFELALSYSKNPSDENIKMNFIREFDRAINHIPIDWKISMMLFSMMPETFITLDSDSLKLLSTHEAFEDDFKKEVGSLEDMPYGDVYLRICQTCMDSIKKFGDFKNFAEFSHAVQNTDDNENVIRDEFFESGIGDYDIDITHYWLFSLDDEGWNNCLKDE